MTSENKTIYYFGFQLKDKKHSTLFKKKSILSTSSIFPLTVSHGSFIGNTDYLCKLIETGQQNNLILWLKF